MKKILLKTSLFLVLFLHCCGLTAQHTNANPVQYILVHEAEEGSLKKDPKDSSSYILQLYQVKPNILYFSTGLPRETGLFPVEQFIRTWSMGANSFKTDHPNVAVSFLDFVSDDREKNVIDVLEIKEPIYSPKTKMLSFKAQPLKNTKVSCGTFKNIVLVIDLYSCSWCGGPPNKFPCIDNCTK